MVDVDARSRAEDAEALRRVLLPAGRQDGVVTTRDVAAAHLSERHLRLLLRRGDWLPLLRGSYLARPEVSGLSLERSWARAAVLTVPGAVIGLASAARLHGLDGVPPPAATQVVLAPGRESHRRQRLEPHARVLARGETTDVRGIAVTSGARTLADLVPTLSRLDALGVLDSALATGLVDRQGLAAAARTAAGRRGSLGVQDLWLLADGLAESPLESRVRLRCVDGGVAPDELQVLVRDEHGHVIARGDLGFRRRSRPHRGLLILEADGRAVHSAPEALYRDRWRANALVALGHDVVRCTWDDALTAHRIPAMVRAAL